ncbi:hypothetical protein RYX36_016391 [Vicia faba]
MTLHIHVKELLLQRFHSAAAITSQTKSMENSTASSPLSHILNLRLFLIPPSSTTSISSDSDFDSKVYLGFGLNVRMTDDDSFT